MFRIDNSTAVVSQPAPPVVGTPGFFTDGSPSGGVPATVVPAWWLNMVQEELYNAISALGAAPSKTDNTQLATALRGRLLSVKVVTSSGMYVPTNGAKFVIAVLQAGGGAGGSCPSTGAGQQATAGGGCRGGYGKALFVVDANIQAGLTVTIGAAGAPSAVGSNAGGAGGATSFGTRMSVPGGPGGTAGTASAATNGLFNRAQYGSLPTVVSGTLLESQYMVSGAPPIVLNVSMISGGVGGDSLFGIGGAPSSGGPTPVGSAAGYGSGGGGAAQVPSFAGAAGAAGTPGIAFFFEYG